MPRRESDQLNAPAAEEGVAADDKRIRPLAHNICECCTNLSAAAGVVNLNLQPHRASRLLNLFHCKIGARCIGGIDQDGNASSPRNQLAQKLQSLSHQFTRKKIDARHVAAGPSEARDKANPDGVLGATMNTMGIVVVAALRIEGTSSPAVAMTATCRRTRSVASSVSLSLRFSAKRYTIATFSPSM